LPRGEGTGDLRMEKVLSLLIGRPSTR